MLKAHKIAFRYQKKAPWLLFESDLTIRAGEIVGIYGPSGHGKSTLAKLLAGYLLPSKGRIHIDGHDLPRNKACPVQLLFQHPELAVNPRWTIHAILNEAGTPQSSLLEELAITTHWFDRYPHELSGGELQRVCLARALTVQTRFLLCDEMTSMLDALTQASIWKRVLNIATRQNLGLLVVSHDRALLDKLCHRIIPWPSTAPTEESRIILE